MKKITTVLLVLISLSGMSQTTFFCFQETESATSTKDASVMGKEYVSIDFDKFYGFTLDKTQQENAKSVFASYTSQSSAEFTKLGLIKCAKVSGKDSDGYISGVKGEDAYVVVWYNGTSMKIAFPGSENPKTSYEKKTFFVPKNCIEKLIEGMK